MDFKRGQREPGSRNRTATFPGPPVGGLRRGRWILSSSVSFSPLREPLAGSLLAWVRGPGLDVPLALGSGQTLRWLFHSFAGKLALPVCF